MSASRRVIPQNVFDFWLKKLMPSTSLVLLCLLNMRNKKNVVITTNHEIKKIIGMTKGTVINALKELTRVGVITKTTAQPSYMRRPYKILLCMDVIDQPSQNGEKI